MAAHAGIETPNRSLPTELARVREDVAEILTAAGIALAVLHGSRAQGREHTGSDADVGILATGGRSLSYSEMGALAADLSALLAIEADVSDLATTDAVFRFEVARSARILFEDRPGTFADFLARTLIDYSDIQRFVPELVEGVARAARRGASPAGGVRP